MSILLSRGAVLIAFAVTLWLEGCARQRASPSAPPSPRTIAAPPRLTDYRADLAMRGELVERVIDGYKFCYADVGRGPVVILIHGLGGSLYDWRHNIRPIADAGFHVIAVDLLGAGESDLPEKADYSVFAQARRIRGLMDALGIDKATLVGNSYGGGVVLAFAQDWPERVDAIVPIDTVCYPEKIPAYVWLSELPMVAEGAMAVAPIDVMLRKEMRRNFVDDSKLVAAEMDNYIRELQSQPRRRALLQTVRSLLPQDSTEFLARLKEIRRPALIIWGRRDVVRPVEHGERLACDVPGARLVVLDNVGHIPNQEVPETVNALVIEFLRSAK